MGLPLLVAVIGAVAGGAIVEPRTPPTAVPGIQGRGALPEACTLFTVEEVSKALGRPLGRSRQKQEPAGTTCAFSAAGGTINISVTPSSTKKDFDDMKKLLIDQGVKVEPITGVGDDAYWWDNRIYARVGNRWLAAWNGDPRQPTDKVRKEMLALAALGVPKLR
jgi:hypothetical protein